MSLRLLPPILVAALVLSACGGDDDDDAAPGSDAAPADAAPSGALDAAPIVCHVPAPAEIGIGTAVIGEVNADNTEACFWVEVPDGLDEVTFSIDGVGADLNLDVGYGLARTLLYNAGAYWPAPRASGPVGETVVIEEPDDGPYFVKVAPAGRNEYSEFSLLVGTTPATSSAPTGRALPGPDTCGGTATVVDLGTSVSGQLPASDLTPAPRSLYCVEVPEGTATLTVELTGLTGNLDVLVQQAVAPELWFDRSRGGETRTVVVDAPEATAYYVEIVPANAGAGSPYTITVSG